MASFELVGYTAGLLVAVALIPQLIKSWKTKSTKDISIIWTSILMTGLALWIVYGIGNLIWPIIVFATIEFLMTLSLFVLKLMYK
ncbi:hypothetical protein CMO83_04355 [Candidatus Woesearchaeota archaeon]|jgi:MtN3 and saliva related transmembrane protein|nr:hypothetical protein [Candidatus Woesearchaeota archaeon]|tara:strand:- start:7113 stop:7367 length:255 start_codon:yes stop_codon:yes gene_type:complete